MFLKLATHWVYIQKQSGTMCLVDQTNKVTHGLPPLVRSCIGCVVARASIGNPEDNALLCIPADLSSVVLLSIAVFKLDGHFTSKQDVESRLR